MYQNQKVNTIESEELQIVNSPYDVILSCTNISLALLDFGMLNNLRRLILLVYKKL